MLSFFDSLIATLFFIVIIATLLSSLSYFNLVFPLIFTYSSRETLMEIVTFRGFCLCHLRSSGILVKICSKAFISQTIIFIITAFNNPGYIYSHFFARWQVKYLIHIQRIWSEFGTNLKCIWNWFVDSRKEKRINHNNNLNINLRSHKTT